MFLLLNLILFVFLTFSLVFILNKIVFSYIPVFQQNFILNTFILIPLSLYFSSVLYFFNLILFENSTVSLIFLEISLILIFFYIFSYKFKNKKVIYQKITSNKNDNLNKILNLFFYFLFVFVILIFLIKSFRSPYGEIDAALVWNRAARFLFRDSGEYWLNNFLLESNFHAGHPFYLGATIARIWTYLNIETKLAPISFHLIHYISTILLLFYSLKFFLRKNINVVISCIFLCSSVLFLQLSVNQYADIPISYFILFSFIFLAASQINKIIELELFFLAGFFIGIASWVKNEGLIYALSLLLSLIFFDYLKNKKISKKILFFIIGSFITTIPALIKKFFYSAPNHYFSLSLKEKIYLITDFDRLITIIKSIISVFVVNGNYLIIFLVAITYIIGINKKADFKIFKIFLVYFLFSISFFIIIFLQMPYDDIYGIIKATYGRWQMQLLPTCLFSVFLILKEVKN